MASRRNAARPSSRAAQATAPPRRKRAAGTPPHPTGYWQPVAAILLGLFVSVILGWAVALTQHYAAVEAAQKIAALH